MAAYYLSARIRATDHGRLDETRQKLLALQAVTRKEPACYQFQVLEDAARAGDFLLWECWEGKAGLEAHHQAAHTQAYLAQGLTDIVEMTALNVPETEKIAR